MSEGTKTRKSSVEKAEERAKKAEGIAIRQRAAVNAITHATSAIEAAKEVVRAVQKDNGHSARLYLDSAAQSLAEARNVVNTVWPAEAPEEEPATV